MAALVGMQIDNVLIEIDGEEVPILDGSSEPFIEHLQGLERKNKMHKKFIIPLSITLLLLMKIKR